MASHAAKLDELVERASGGGSIRLAVVAADQGVVISSERAVTQLNSIEPHRCGARSSATRSVVPR